MTIEQLKGRKFRRNKYGLSLWEDTIKDVKLDLVPRKYPDKRSTKLLDYVHTQKALNKKYGLDLVVSVVGEKTFSTYNINEIIIY